MCGLLKALSSPFTSFLWHLEISSAVYQHQRCCVVPEGLRTDRDVHPHALWASKSFPHQPQDAPEAGGNCRWVQVGSWCPGWWQGRGWDWPGQLPFRRHRDLDSRTELPSSARTEFVFDGRWRPAPPRHSPAGYSPTPREALIRKIISLIYVIIDCGIIITAQRRYPFT